MSEVNFRANVEKHVNQVFSKNCSTSSTCVQSIDIQGDLNVKAHGDCVVEFKNQCKQTSGCDMRQSVADILPYLKDDDLDREFVDELGKLLTDENGKPAFDKNTVKGVSLQSLNQVFHNHCGAQSASYQAIESKKDVNIECYDQSTVRMLNEANHTAICATNLANQAMDKLFREKKPEEPEELEVSTLQRAIDAAVKHKKVIICTVVLLALAYLYHRKFSEHKTVHNEKLSTPSKQSPGQKTTSLL